MDQNNNFYRQIEDAERERAKKERKEKWAKREKSFWKAFLFTEDGKPKSGFLVYTFCLSLVFVLLLSLLAGGRDLSPWRKGAAWITAALAKFAVLYLLVVKLLCAVLPLKELQIAVFTAMFSWPQLVTALAGGGVALLLAPLLRRALKR